MREAELERLFWPSPDRPLGVASNEPRPPPIWDTDNMAAAQLYCQECGSGFYGRADARYCTNACRQRAHRARVLLESASTTTEGETAESVVSQARRTREQSRVVVRNARRVSHQSSMLVSRSGVALRSVMDGFGQMTIGSTDG